MKYFLIIFIAVPAIIVNVVAMDYCHDALCPADALHIGCENPLQFSPECPAGAKILNSFDFRGEILKLHNWYRNYAASGIHPLSPACKMETMKWDDELEYLAQLNVQTCKSQYDRCRNTHTYPNVGQNKGSYNTYIYMDPKVITRFIIKEWFEQGSKATKELMGNFYQSSNMPPLMHFTTMIMDKNNRIGCTMAGVPIDNTLVSYLLICNYAHAPLNHTTIYSACKFGGQDCKVPGKKPLPYICQ